MIDRLNIVAYKKMLYDIRNNFDDNLPEFVCNNIIEDVLENVWENSKENITSYIRYCVETNFYY